MPLRPSGFFLRVSVPLRQPAAFRAAAACCRAWPPVVEGTVGSFRAAASCSRACSRLSHHPPAAFRPPAAERGRPAPRRLLSAQRPPAAERGRPAPRRLLSAQRPPATERGRPAPRRLLSAQRPTAAPCACVAWQAFELLLPAYRHCRVGMLLARAPDWHGVGFEVFKLYSIESALHVLYAAFCPRREPPFGASAARNYCCRFFFFERRFLFRVYS